MTPQEKLNIRLLRVLNDPALLKALVQNMQGHPDHIAALLAEITDDNLREQLRLAIEAG